MFLIILFVVSLSFIPWFLIRWRRVKQFWAVRKVPHHPPHPIMGSLTFLQRQNPAVWLRKMYKDFRSPYVGAWLFWHPLLIINSPEIARRVLIKDADIFRNRFVSSGKSDPIGGLNLFTDPIWSSLRRRLTVVFTAAKLRALQKLIASKSHDLVKRINMEMKKDDSINLRETLVDYTTDVFGEASFGIAYQATLQGNSVIKKIAREFMAFSVFRGLSWSSIFFFPKLVDIFRFSFFPTRTIEYLRLLLRDIVQQRGGYNKQIKESRDLLDALLKMRHEAAIDGEDVNEDLILAQAAIFFLGGFDTTAITLTWAIYEMAFQPDLQENLYQELLKAKQGIDGKDFDPATLSELPYLNAVIKETLRKFATMGWLDRVALKDYKIDEKLTIPGGTAIYVNTTGMHWDPDYYPEPEKFDPDRFLLENEANIKPYTFMPFGEGPRSCIGMRFAYQSMRYALSSVFLNYKVTKAPKAPEPNICSIEKKGIFYAPENKISVIFIPRS